MLDIVDLYHSYQQNKKIENPSIFKRVIAILVISVKSAKSNIFPLMGYTSRVIAIRRDELFRILGLVFLPSGIPSGSQQVKFHI